MQLNVPLYPMFRVRNKDYYYYIGVSIILPLCLCKSPSQLASLTIILKYLHLSTAGSK